MTNDELRAIEARANAATAGPWVHETSYGAIGAVEADGMALAQVQQRSLYDHERRNTDAIFIAHARTDVPALVAEVRRLRGLVEAAYREGHVKGGEQATDFYQNPDESADWDQSDARKALEGA